MDPELVERLLRAAQDVVNGEDRQGASIWKLNQAGFIVTDQEAFLELKAVVQAISDEAVAIIRGEAR